MKQLIACLLCLCTLLCILIGCQTTSSNNPGGTTGGVTEDGTADVTTSILETVDPYQDNVPTDLNFDGTDIRRLPLPVVPMQCCLTGRHKGHR